MRLLSLFLATVLLLAQSGQQQLLISQKISGGDVPWLTITTPAGARNDITGCMGALLTVGGSNITVTSLGRYVVSGNSGTHTVRLLTWTNDTTGAQLISASVNTSGASAGTIKYTAVTPTVLTASTKYYLVSSETASGDQWLDQSSTLSVTSAAALIARVYSESTCTADPYSAFVTVAVENMYVGVDFLYHF